MFNLPPESQSVRGFYCLVSLVSVACDVSIVLGNFAFLCKEMIHFEFKWGLAFVVFRNFIFDAHEVVVGDTCALQNLCISTFPHSSFFTLLTVHCLSPWCPVNVFTQTID